MFVSADKPFDAIIFDLGGVLVKYRDRPQILDWIHDRLTLKDLWRWWLASDLVKNYETGKISSDAFAAGIIAEFKLTITKDEYLRSFALGHEAVYEGVPALLTRLAPRYTLGVLSNTNETLWGRCETLGILNFFPRQFPSHKIGFVKPDRQIYEYLLRALNLPAERVLFFDDHEQNIAAARAMGIAAYQVLGIRAVTEKLAELAIL